MKSISLTNPGITLDILEHVKYILTERNLPSVLPDLDDDDDERYTAAAHYLGIDALLLLTDWVVPLLREQHPSVNLVILPTGDHYRSVIHFLNSNYSAVLVDYIFRAFDPEVTRDLDTEALIYAENADLVGKLLARGVDPTAKKNMAIILASQEVISMW